MEKPVLCFVVIGCLGWSISSVAATAGDFVILGEGNAFWTNNLDAPVSKELVKLQKRHTFRSIAFAPAGDWLILTGGNGFYTSNLKLAAAKKLSQLQKPKTDFKCVAFAPDGGWSILWNQNGNWTEGGVPEAAFNKMQEVAQGGGTPRGVALGPDGAWVVLFDDTGIWCGNVPDDLGKVLENAVKKGLTVRCVCFTADGHWICLTSNGWWTSDLEHRASKMIADLEGQHQSLHWVAVAPGPHDFRKWTAVIQRECDGKLSGGYAFAVMHQGKVVAEAAEGWARAPWEKEHASVKWTLDKPMGVASLSKTITAVALLKLWEPTCGYGKLGSTRASFPFDRECAEFAGPGGWYGSINDLSRFLLGLRNHTVLSPATTKMMYNDMLGWDISNPGWEKNGGWFWDEGSGPDARAGAFRSSIYHFPDDVDAMMFMNSEAGPEPEEVLRKAWFESRS